MHRGSRFALPGFLAVLASCGGGDAVPAGQYVRSVCTATTHWQQDIQQRSVALAQTLDPKAGPADQKQALVLLLGGLVAATDAYVHEVEAAGAPDIDGGEDAAAGLTDALTRIDQAFRAARTQGGQLPTDSKESFEQAAGKIGETVNSSVSGIQDPFKDSSELNALSGKEPACQAIQG